jgi:hypothetical protein
MTEVQYADFGIFDLALQMEVSVKYLDLRI